MDRDNQRDLRREATRSFFDSLDQLQKTLSDAEAQQQKSEPTVERETPAKADKKPVKKIDLTELEQAAADIEQFFQSKYPKSTDSQNAQE